MKKVIFVAIIASFAISPSFAAPPGSDNRMTDKLTGNGAISYNDGYFHTYDTCNETQHRKFDTVSCRFEVARPELAGLSGTVGWFSDFDGKIGTITYTIDADGGGYSGKATY